MYNYFKFLLFFIIKKLLINNSISILILDSFLSKLLILLNALKSKFLIEIIYFFILFKRNNGNDQLIASIEI